MATNLGLDEKLLARALKLSGRPTKRETVNDALREYIARRERLGALQGFGSIEFEPSWDYKRARRHR